MSGSCGILKQHKIITTKKGARMAFVQLEDYSGIAEIILFPKIFKIAEHWLSSATIFIVKGMLDETGRICKIKAHEFIPFERALTEWPSIQKMIITLPETITEELLTTIKNKSIAGTVSLEIILHEQGKKINFFR